HGDPDNGKENSSWDISLGLSNLAAQIAYVVVAPIGVNGLHHCRAQSGEPDPRQTKSSSREVEYLLGIEMLKATPNQPQQSSHDASPQQYGDFADGLDSAIQQNH